MTQLGISSDSIIAGTQAVTTDPAALNSGAACGEVLVQNDAGSASNLLVGDGTTQPISIPPGGAMSLAVSVVSVVWVSVASGSATVNWLARS